LLSVYANTDDILRFYRRPTRQNISLPRAALGKHPFAESLDFCCEFHMVVGKMGFCCELNKKLMAKSLAHDIFTVSGSEAFGLLQMTLG
jgi:hypothetical protein